MSSKRNLCPAFKQIRGGQKTPLASVDFQLPSAQNTPYANVGYYYSVEYSVSFSIPSCMQTLNLRSIQKRKK